MSSQTPPLPDELRARLVYALLVQCALNPAEKGVQP
jgi:hypothetical protein